jgi:CubicO group peptidase (beta-lactamase class C family)
MIEDTFPRKSLPDRVRERSIKLARRRFLHLTAGVAALPVLPPPYPATAQSAPDSHQIAQPTSHTTPSERAAMSNLANAFMQNYDVPGLSVAIGRADALLYEDAFGLADREKREACSSMHLFRIASVTKPITSVAIFSLIEGEPHSTDRQNLRPGSAHRN